MRHGIRIERIGSEINTAFSNYAELMDIMKQYPGVYITIRDPLAMNDTLKNEIARHNATAEIPLGGFPIKWNECVTFKTIGGEPINKEGDTGT